MDRLAGRLSFLHTLVQFWCKCYTKAWKIWTCWILNPPYIRLDGHPTTAYTVQTTCAVSSDQTVVSSNLAGGRLDFGVI
jgi:hypothetical protein